MGSFDTITCLTDLGTADESVGLLHSILHDLAPAAKVIDLCHDIEPGDVRAGTLMLARSVPYLSPGLVLASVGSLSDRPAIAVSVGDGQSILVGPDNGLLGAVVAVVGGADSAVQLTNNELHTDSPGLQHLTRDVLAPVVGHLAARGSISDLGEEINPSLLLPSLIPIPRIESDGTVTAEVIRLTRQGAAQLNIDRDALVGLGETLLLGFGDEQRVVRIQRPEEVNPGHLAIVDDEYGLLAIATGSNEGIIPAALEAGSEITLKEVT